MFVLKSKYDELKRELDVKNVELKNQAAELEQQLQQLKDINERITTLENQTVEKGKRLTEEELSTLIAVDFINLIQGEDKIHPKLLPLLWELFYGLEMRTRTELGELV